MKDVWETIYSSHTDAERARARDGKQALATWLNVVSSFSVLYTYENYIMFRAIHLFRLRFARVFTAQTERRIECGRKEMFETCTRFYCLPSIIRRDCVCQTMEQSFILLCMAFRFVSLLLFVSGDFSSFSQFFSHFVLFRTFVFALPLTHSLSMRAYSKYFAGIKHVYWIFVGTVLTSSTSEIGSTAAAVAYIFVREFYLYWFNDFHEFSPSNHYSHEMLAMHTIHMLAIHCLPYVRCVVSVFPNHVCVGEFVRILFVFAKATHLPFSLDSFF